MRLQTAIRKVYEAGFKAQTFFRGYKILTEIDEMIKEMAATERVTAQEIVMASVYGTYSEWLDRNKKSEPVKEEAVTTIDIRPKEMILDNIPEV